MMMGVPIRIETPAMPIRFPVLPLAFVLSLGLVPAAARADAQAPAGPGKGSLVIAGGALRADNAPVWKKIVELAGGPGARIAVFPTAAGNPERSGRLTAEILAGYGARPFVVPLAAKLAGTDVRKAADDPQLAASVRAAGGAFFTGGDQGRITAALRHADGGNSAVLDALWDMYRRGGVIAGTSAGAAIMSKTMFYEGRAPLPTLRDGITDGRDIAPGLGFIGDDVFVDQHLLIRGRFARMLPAMLAKHYRLGLGIDENTAAVVAPDRSIAVIGYKGALLLDLGQASVDAARTGFNVTGARISYLDSGDRYDPASGRFTPGPDKEKVDPADPSYRGPLFTPDILGNTAVVDLLMKLCDSDQARATGIAFGDPAGAAADRGFEFTFTRTPESEGWTSNRADTYSVYRVRMDVRPVKLTLPLYRED
ncbi:cyanophycinase [Telluria mixta]|uniref:Cyanophycinase n=1 Tax=Telluria mixta TaxID=34071 RepID=A0ABT2C708_9BURK|nr:cyanophycinase [Telluria mixta]MCS0633189.1 cyanophycinase [Telluria mixta]WEM94674.1 cyanophycinase [Telluria mixta]